MLFNSFEFIFVLFPISVFIYFLTNHFDKPLMARILLIISCLIFYSWTSFTYLPLILGSIVFNFNIGKYLSKDVGHKRKLLFASIILNLMFLAYYKYKNFALEIFNQLFSTDFDYMDLILPLAISFFTFQQIAYIVDCFKGKVEHNDFSSYMLFVAFFPQLIAGPIVHHKEMMPQFLNQKKYRLDFSNILHGLTIFFLGLFKKVMIADHLSLFVGKGFDGHVNLNLVESWTTSLSYTFQLYFDFSGYTDMALGAALIFNIKLPINFNSPYKACDIQDFWRRWHITLSHFLRDYIYIPLGGNRVGLLNTYRNVMITFLLGGLWHGAGWSFLFWGFMHGIAIVIHRLWTTLVKIKIPTALAWFITFNYVNIAWVFFRAETWKDAIRILKGMFGYHDIVMPNFLSFLKRFEVIDSFKPTAVVLYNIHGSFLTILLIITLLAVVLIFNNTNEFSRQYSLPKIAVISVIISLGIMNLFEVGEFLYFNF